MEKVYKKKEEGVFIPIRELKKIITDFEVKVTGEDIKITNENYKNLSESNHKLSWDETFKEIAREKENWSDFDVDLDKGIE